MDPIKPVDLADLKAGTAIDISHGNKAASIGDLYQLSLNVGQFIEEQGNNLRDDDRKKLCADVADYAARIAELDAAMDEADLFIWNEALEHMEASFRDRCPELLVKVRELKGGQPVVTGAAPSLQFTN